MSEEICDWCKSREWIISFISDEKHGNKPLKLCDKCYYEKYIEWKYLK